MKIDAKKNIFVTRDSSKTHILMWVEKNMVGMRVAGLLSRIFFWWRLDDYHEKTVAFLLSDFRYLVQILTLDLEPLLRTGHKTHFLFGTGFPDEKILGTCKKNFRFLGPLLEKLLINLLNSFTPEPSHRWPGKKFTAFGPPQGSFYLIGPRQSKGCIAHNRPSKFWKTKNREAIISTTSIWTRVVVNK
jgi:hypothetical protein